MLLFSGQKHRFRSELGLIFWPTWQHGESKVSNTESTTSESEDQELPIISSVQSISENDVEVHLADENDQEYERASL